MKLLIIGDERKSRRMVAWGFASGAYQIKIANSSSQVEAIVGAESFQIACIDWKMQEDDAATVVNVLHRRLPELPIVALVAEKAEKDSELAPRLQGLGVAAYLVSPFQIENLHALVSAHALPEPLKVAKVESGDEEPEPLVTDYAPMPEPEAAAGPLVSSTMMANDDQARRAFELAGRAAKSNAAILILGETGTGKSLLAQSIHQRSPICDKPFVTVNCPCLSRELLESDLFGHVRGSFTGAVQDTLGKVAVADGGTLFLDEIGDLPMSLQPKLLRLLQEKQYERVGEATSHTANVRIIAATNRYLKDAVATGHFREDLYYRLNVIAIDVPALRGRPAQIMGAAERFLDGVCEQLNKTRPTFSAEARRILEAHTWPGNLRELRNVVERAAILSNEPVLEANDFPSLLAQAPASRFQIGGPISLHALEAAHIRMVMAGCSSLEEAAKILEIDKSTLYRKRKQMDADSKRKGFATPLDPDGPVPVAVGD